MWRAICIALAAALPGAAWAEWHSTGTEGGTAPRAGVCTEGPGGSTLCFGLSCPPGAPLRFDLAVVGEDDIAARDRLTAHVFVGDTALAPLNFERSTGGRFAAPLTEAHLPGIERLKAGSRADLRYWPAEDAPPERWRLTLTGSRISIEAVEAVCPMPDFAAAARAARLSEDPAAQVLADMQAACGALGGTVTVNEGYAREIDIDGAGPIDLRLDHGQLACSAVDGLVCGPAGCLNSLWQAQPGGGYLRVFLNTLQDVETTLPGRLRFTFLGSRCGRAGAGPCTQDLVLQAEEFVPAPDDGAGDTGAADQL